VLIFLFTMYLPAQEVKTDGNPENATIQLDETQFRISASEPEDQDPAATNSIWLFVRMVLVLALVIVCIYVVVYLLRRGLNPRSPSDLFLKKAASLTLSPGKAVHVITLQDHAYIVGTADSSISLLGEIKDKELIDALNLQSEVYPGKRAPDFASLLSLFMPKPKKTSEPKKTDFGEEFHTNFSFNGTVLHSNQNPNTGNFTDTVSETAQNLSKQRDRLRNSPINTEDIR
jgi:flagellar biogenesis protein FliO